jgi:GT2 family glycosyltransferase
MKPPRDAPAVSVLISTKDRRDLLDQTLASLAGLDYPRDRLEIVVVEETDNPRPLPGMRYVPIPREHRGFGYTRNVALAQATHEIVVFTDDDCLVDSRWLRELIAPLLSDESIVGVAGAVLVPKGSIIGECENILGFPAGGLRSIADSGGQIEPTRSLSTCNCAYRKAAVLEAGGFDLGTKYSGEDSLLADRITVQHRCVFNPKAIVFHKPRGTFRGIFRWFVRRGRNQVEIHDLVLDRRRHFWYEMYLSLTVRGLLLLPVIWWAGRWAFPLLTLLAGIYYMTMLWRYRYAVRYGRPLAAFLLTPVVKVVMDLGMEWGRITGLWELRGRRR